MTPRSPQQPRRKIEEGHHRALVQFIKLTEGQLPELAFVKHTRNESSGGPKVTRRDRASGRMVEIPLDVIRGAELGVRAGVWDFEYLGRNRVPIDDKPAFFYAGLAIELKSDVGSLSPEQKTWRTHYLHNGWYTVVFRHHVDAAQFLVRWVGGNPNHFHFT
jgi:hypothetical protein